MGMGRGAKKRSYSASPDDYRLLEEVGHGASATVYRAIYLPTNELLAVKCLDLDRCNSNLDDIRREAQTMSLIEHPNIIRACCSFVVDSYLWVVMPFMAEGSCFHLMKIAYQDGFEESIIRSILKETLIALEYLHKHGHIHRDVKAGNILLDSSGRVKLGDFGVSACMFDKGDRQRLRNTFVGTPCWMAPEVLQPESGYDFKADIWSFGITALELAHGHAPFSKYPPMKILLMTLQNAPPGLDYERDKKFSKSFKEVVAMCLVKDQTKRPTAEKLLKHSFFKQAKPSELSLKSILADLPPLWDRVKALQLKDAAQLALKKMPSAEQEALSQSEYQRGVSAWNFDVEDLKAQAAMIEDDEDLPRTKEDDKGPKLFFNNKSSCDSTFSHGQSIFTDESQYNSISVWFLNISIEPMTLTLIDLSHPNTVKLAKREIIVPWKSQWLGAWIPKMKSVEADIMDSSSHERVDYENRFKDDPLPSTSKQSTEPNHWKNEVGKRHQTYSGPLPGTVHNNSSSDKSWSAERFDNDIQLATDKKRRDVRKSPNLSGPLMLPNRASANSLSAPIRSSGGIGDSLEDKSKGNVIQIKGRFSVTSEHLDLVKDIPLCTVAQRPSQGTSLRKSASVGEWLVHSKQLPGSQQLKERNNSLHASVLMPHIQNLFQQTSFQQDLLVNLLNTLQQNDAVDAVQNGMASQVSNLENDLLVETATSERERLLLVKIADLQARMNSLTDELVAAKLKHLQLQQQLNAVCSREDDDDLIKEET
ncbi:probable serine/threonine-protein kinase DDB_G0284251 [Dioscorea cayenensis subsp. rotundata]|uniref:Probable serine/threonine-protein kinase DDB_G0284251 n=1 Tax=Dioscorea cayennensis subsp. rotundata TaxID=55577 RepID=A0AB40CT91_DIOCR|nr:probable serine/threonine-protein kinase DDB_G0284251 [Dioscorea cayenensis subsp. rotundata]